MSAIESPDELAENLGHKRELILDALVHHDGRAHTGQITDYTNIPHNGINYHFKKLVDGGLIERDGRVTTGKGIDPYLYALTDAGEEVHRNMDGAKHTNLKAAVDSLESNVRAVENTVSDFRKEQRETTRENTERIDEFEDRLEKMESVVNRQSEAIKALLKANPDAREQYRDAIDD